MRYLLIILLLTCGCTNYDKQLNKIAKNQKTIYKELKQIKYYQFEIDSTTLSNEYLLYQIDSIINVIDTRIDSMVLLNRNDFP